MGKAYQEDLTLLGKDRPANRKLVYSRTLEQELRNVTHFIIQIYVCERFLEIGGLGAFQNWLKKLPNGMEPSLTLKIKLFNILLSLNAREQHIASAPELQKIIQKNKTSMTKDLRELSESIVSKWGRIAYDDIN